MAQIVPVVLILWSMLGIDVELHRVEGPVRFTDLYGEQRLAPGALACPEGEEPQLWLSRDASAAVIAHELAHAIDCSDDGLLNGSPSSRPGERPEWVSDYCWSSDAEWHACAVARHTASRQPATGPPRLAGAPPDGRKARDDACEPQTTREPAPDPLLIWTGSLNALARPHRGLSCHIIRIALRGSRFVAPQRATRIIRRRCATTACLENT